MDEGTSQLPSSFGPYRVEEEIGRGGMGTVLKARHQETGALVAIKVLPPELGRSRGFRERFHREVQALATLNHPNIVQFIDDGEQDGLPWYAMEYVPGRSLNAEVATRRCLPWREAVDLALQVCHALRHAHDRGVVHRDLKLSNLILTPEGQVKLTDFGIARVFDLRGMTGSGGVVGTAEYMSPEQAGGKPATRRSDLYSLGVVLFALVTGRLPFQGRTVLDLMHQHVYARFNPPRTYVPELPAELDRLIVELLAKEPSQRPADAYVTARRLDAIRRQAAFGAEGRGQVGSSLSDFQLGPGLDTPDPRGDDRSGPSAAAATTLNPATPELDLATGEAEIPAPAPSLSAAARSPRPRTAALTVGTGLPRGRRWQQGLDWNKPSDTPDFARWRDRLTSLVLVLGLVGLAGLLVWGLWPVSDAELAARGEALMATQRPEDDLRARDTAFEPLLARHPTGPWAKLAKQRLAEIAERAQIRAARLQARSGLRVGTSPAAMSEPERFYVRAEALWQSGDFEGARRRFRALVILFADDPTAKPWIEVARTRIAEIEHRPSQPAQAARKAALAKARRLAAEGHQAEARAIWNALLTLYHDDPEAQPDLAEAQAALENGKSK
jgi:hypothetical protein